MRKKSLKGEWTTEKIRLARAVSVAPMPHTKVKLMTNAAGLTLIKPRGEIVPKYKVCAANGLLDLVPEKPLELILSNFCDHNQRF